MTTEADDGMRMLVDLIMATPGTSLFHIDDLPLSLVPASVDVWLFGHVVRRPLRALQRSLSDKDTQWASLDQEELNATSDIMHKVVEPVRMEFSLI